MKATVAALGALLWLVGSASLASAQVYCPPVTLRPPAPDACGPGFYSACPAGDPYGPNYYLRPPWPPVQGVPPFYPPGTSPVGAPRAPQAPYPGCAPTSYYSHPWARSPRDFFMWTEVNEDRMARDRVPLLVR
jgi:hypothetical protein